MSKRYFLIPVTESVRSNLMLFIFSALTPRANTTNKAGSMYFGISSNLIIEEILKSNFHILWKIKKRIPQITFLGLLFMKLSFLEANTYPYSEQWWIQQSSHGAISMYWEQLFLGRKIPEHTLVFYLHDETLLIR